MFKVIMQTDLSVAAYVNDIVGRRMAEMDYDLTPSGWRDLHTAVNLHSMFTRSNSSSVNVVVESLTNRYLKELR